MFLEYSRPSGVNGSEWIVCVIGIHSSDLVEDVPGMHGETEVNDMDDMFVGCIIV